ncbi:hypothetical protein [uncultured Croceitalea sp.]|uniref:hypothetical protein n=1 Tax=uncultured Croceitalea sp. TaxID=1798908 RepID=UPI003305D46A
MKKSRNIAIVFLAISLVLGVVFFLNTTYPKGLNNYFKAEYYNQFGPLAICVELLVAGYYLFVKNTKANFALAVFAFTALLDPIFNVTGLFSSLVPLYATILFVICALVALWLSFTDTFGLGKISMWAAFGSFLLGTAVELFFNL